jgi:hypothetical protein
VCVATTAVGVVAESGSEVGAGKDDGLHAADSKIMTMNKIIGRCVIELFSPLRFVQALR